MDSVGVVNLIPRSDVFDPAQYTKLRFRNKASGKSVLIACGDRLDDQCRRAERTWQSLLAGLKRRIKPTTRFRQSDREVGSMIDARGAASGRKCFAEGEALLLRRPGVCTRSRTPASRRSGGRSPRRSAMSTTGGAARRPRPDTVRGRTRARCDRPPSERRGCEKCRPHRRTAASNRLAGALHRSMPA